MSNEQKLKLAIDFTNGGDNLSYRMLQKNAECCTLFSRVYEGTPSKDLFLDQEITVFPGTDHVFFTGEPNGELHPRTEGVAVIRLGGKDQVTTITGLVADKIWIHDFNKCPERASSGILRAGSSFYRMFRGSLSNSTVTESQQFNSISTPEASESK